MTSLQTVEALQKDNHKTDDKHKLLLPDELKDTKKIIKDMK